MMRRGDKGRWTKREWRHEAVLVERVLSVISGSRNAEGVLTSYLKIHLKLGGIGRRKRKKQEKATRTKQKQSTKTISTNQAKGRLSLLAFCGGGAIMVPIRPPSLYLSPLGRSSQPRRREKDVSVRRSIMARQPFHADLCSDGRRLLPSSC